MKHLKYAVGKGAIVLAIEVGNGVFRGQPSISCKIIEEEMAKRMPFALFQLSFQIGLFFRLLIPVSYTHLVRDLSGGNQQKVAIAKWNCSDTLLYIMDDPTRGVDVGAKVEVYNLINQTTAQGASVLLISSDMPELLEMCIRDSLWTLRSTANGLRGETNPRAKRF